MGMRFRVLRQSRSVPSLNPGECALMQDQWNDYGFQTQYLLYAESQGKTKRVGLVKILKRGQTSSDGIQISEDFAQLSDDFVSVGESLDYYQHLAELKGEQRDAILAALNDAVRRPELQQAFGHEEGWSTSVFRDRKDADIQEFLSLARSLVDNDYTSLPDEDLTFTFQPYGWEEPIKFNFHRVAVKPDDWFSGNEYLPGRIIALIGQNGSGKSTLLARLARVAHGSLAKRNLGTFGQLGEITPIGLGFPRIIAVSYSAFDSFALPGVAPKEQDEPDERAQIVEDARRGEGRFIFCGLRDIATELEREIESSKMQLEVDADRVISTCLKPIEALAEEFEGTINRVRESNRWSLFHDVLQILGTDPSFSDWEDASDLEAILALAPMETFLRFSTGHKIVLQIVASLSAYVTPRSLMLFDEPEMHLHPPLLAALMHAIRKILGSQRAFGIVATHSPVVIQETLGRNVFVIRREGKLAAAIGAPSETFGENVGSLTNNVFGMNSEVTDFHRVLDMLVKQVADLDQIERLFHPHGLSYQARAYVMMRLRRAAGE